MDIGNINEFASAFIKFGEFIPVAAGACAGLSAVALLSGVRRVQTKDRNLRFLKDPDAAQQKYVFAHSQLLESQDPSLATSTRVVSDPTRPAITLCIEAFAASMQMKSEQPSSEQPKSEQPKSEQPKSEQPKSDQSKSSRTKSNPSQSFEPKPAQPKPASEKRGSIDKSDGKQK